MFAKRITGCVAHQRQETGHHRTNDGGSNHNNDGGGDSSGNGNDGNEHTQLPVAGPNCSKPPAPLPASKRGRGILKKQRPPLGGTQY
eukprot:5589516-Pleurochrysis_carterae.AAC.1